MMKYLIASALVVGFAMPAYAAAPDLVPEFNVTTGKVTVKNVGDGASAKGVVTIKCKRVKPPVAGGGGGCPELGPRLAANYQNPAFPDAVSVNVPALRPGASYDHTLSFFAALLFASGTYEFTLTADAGNTSAESNEANNVKAKIKVVP